MVPFEQPLDLAKDNVGEAVRGMKRNFLKDTVALAERNAAELSSCVDRKQAQGPQGPPLRIVHGVSL
jgi:hypothetical protein